VKVLLGDGFIYEKIMKKGSLESKNGPFYFVKSQTSAPLMVTAGA
jgi:hypothetical protein